MDKFWELKRRARGDDKSDRTTPSPVVLGWVGWGVEVHPVCILCGHETRK